MAIHPHILRHYSSNPNMYINSNNNSDEDVQDDDDDASLQSDHSDTSSDVTQLDHTDFPTYFRERSGRLFHSHGNAPYPLPVDTPEQQVRALVVQFLRRVWRC